MPPRFLPQHLLLLAALAVVQTAGNNKAGMDQPGAGIDAQKRELERQHQERNTIKRTPEQERQYREQRPDHASRGMLSQLLQHARCWSLSRSDRKLRS